MKKLFSRMTLGIAMLMAAMLSCTSVHADVLNAGTAKVNITPPNPRYPVHDSLYARSLVLEVGEVRIAFISLDLGVYHNENVRKQLMKKYELDELY